MIIRFEHLGTTTQKFILLAVPLFCLLDLQIGMIEF